MILCRVCFTLFALLLLVRTAPAVAPLEDPLGYLTARGVHADAEALRASWVVRAPLGPERYLYAFLLSEAVRYVDAETGTLLSSGEIQALGLSTAVGAAPQLAIASEVVSLPSEESPSNEAMDTRAWTELVLPPLDHEALIAEDAAREDFARGRLRLGVATALPEAITPEQLRTVGTRIATKTLGTGRGIVLRAPGALGIRVLVRFQGAMAPVGLRVGAADGSAPHIAPAPEETHWWSPTVWGDRVAIQLSDTTQTNFVIDKIMQVYRQPGAPGDKAAGACEVDVACHERWADAALGVGGIGTVDRDEFVFCTGSLLVDADPDSNLPYLLTGNHCVASNAEAQPLEIYWLYQTSRCNDTPPDLGDVPRTIGGAVYLAGSGNFFGTDLSLLRLKRNPPSGLTWLGWEPIAPAEGARVVCIHHPNGDFKRISFGDIVDTGIGRLRPASRYHEVGWRVGVTEPGSSGSPLFLESTQRIIGQLYGGSSSCRNSTATDYYGRFDVSYLAIQQFLGVLPMPYDLNGDRRVNATDLQLVVNAALTHPNRPPGDFNADGRVEAVDIQQMVLAVLSFSR